MPLFFSIWGIIILVTAIFFAFVAWRVNKNEPSEVRNLEAWAGASTGALFAVLLGWFPSLVLFGVHMLYMIAQGVA